MKKGAGASQTADEPKNEKHDQNQAENAAETGAAISAVGVISAAAKQQNQQDDNQDSVHWRLFLQLGAAPVSAMLSRNARVTAASAEAILRSQSSSGRVFGGVSSEIT
jgi:hypothetical protein